MLFTSNVLFILKRLTLGAGRMVQWLRSLLWRTKVWFPAPAPPLTAKQSSVIPVLEDLTPSFGLHGYCTRVVYRHI